MLLHLAAHLLDQLARDRQGLRNFKWVHTDQVFAWLWRRNIVPVAIEFCFEYSHQ